MTGRKPRDWSHDCDVNLGRCDFFFLVFIFLFAFFFHGVARGGKDEKFKMRRDRDHRGIVS